MFGYVQKLQIAHLNPLKTIKFVSYNKFSKPRPGRFLGLTQRTGREDVKPCFESIKPSPQYNIMSNLTRTGLLGYMHVALCCLLVINQNRVNFTQSKTATIHQINMADRRCDVIDLHLIRLRLTDR